MVQMDFDRRQITAKIVYYGPGLAGKTTNLRYVYERSPDQRAGELVTINTETDRTLYFDFLPLDLGSVADMQVRLQLYTVPGQVYYNATRQLVLRNADGVVFVADSTPAKRHENLASLANLHENLQAMDLDPMQVPMVMQYNKRDLRNALSLTDLELDLNPTGHYEAVEASAATGQGVFPTLKAITSRLMERLQRDYGTEPPTRRRTRRHSPNPTPAVAQSVNTEAPTRRHRAEDHTRVAQLMPAIDESTMESREHNVRDGLLLAQINLVAQQNADVLQQMRILQRTVERLAYTAEDLKERIRGIEQGRLKVTE